MQKIIEALSNLRVGIVIKEYNLQKQISKILKDAGIVFKREHKLGPRNRVDFLTTEGIAIEVKKGKPNKKQVIKQLERYTNFDEVKAVILVVETSLKIPKIINEKDCISFGLNKLWGIALWYRTT